jgi:hypothetical protein
MTTVFSQSGVISFDPVDTTHAQLVNAFKDTAIQLSNNNLEVTSNNYNFSTVKANVGVQKGLWYYEVTIKSSGTARIGWCTSIFSPENNYSGLGADENSWSYDGSRRQKCHNETKKAAETYGDTWNTNDVIGVLVDTETRRISYYRNGKDLGVAFQNVRVDVPLYPAISVYRNCRLVVNFGRKFQNLPAGASGLNASMTAQEKKDCEKTFNKYHEIGISLAASGNTGRDIKGRGALQLVTDLGGDPRNPLDTTIMVLAWKLKSRTQWEFHHDEWMSTWARVGCFTQGEMKSQLEKWKDEVKIENVFKGLYAFAFEYLKPDKATALEKLEALMAWQMLGIHKRWTEWEKWEKWWKGNDLKGVSKDTWLVMLSFIEKHGKSIKGYSDDDMWPTAIDDFVNDVLM